MSGRHSVAGRLFQSFGPATWNDLCVMSVVYVSVVYIWSTDIFQLFLHKCQEVIEGAKTGLDEVLFICRHRCQRCYMKQSSNVRLHSVPRFVCSSRVQLMCVIQVITHSASFIVLIIV